MSRKPILHILGAGPAGLATGYYAKKYDISFHIFESSERIGGNCQTIEEGEFRFDTGAHRFHDKDKDVTKEIKRLMGKDLIKVDAPSMIYQEGRLINFPLNFSSIIKNLDRINIVKIIYENLYNQIIRGNRPNNFRDLAYKNYGKTLSELFLINYTEKLWGADSCQLQVDIAGDRLKNLDLFSSILGLLFHKSSSSHLDGSFYYPKNGFGTIFDEMGKVIGEDKIKLDSPVEEILHDGKRIKKIVYKNGMKANVDHIINTLPINLLIEIFNPAPPENIYQYVKDFSFRNIRLCVMFLDIPFFSNNASIYLPDKSYPFTRIYEPKNRSVYLAPENKTCIVVEIPYSNGDDISLINDKELSKMIESILIEEKLLEKNQVIGHKIMDINNAYPILTLGKEEKLRDIYSYFNSFSNHTLIGRNAEFKYLHTHDLMMRAKKLIEELLS